MHERGRGRGRQGRARGRVRSAVATTAAPGAAADPSPERAAAPPGAAAVAVAVVAKAAREAATEGVPATPAAACFAITELPHICCRRTCGCEEDASVVADRHCDVCMYGAIWRRR